LKSPVTNTEKVLLGDFLAGTYTTTAEDAFRKVPLYIRVLIFNRIATRSSDLESRWPYLQLGSEVMKHTFPGIDIRNA
jgi:hypothetical protein